MNMVKELTVALVQMDSTLAAVEENIKKAGAYIKKAVQKGAQIVCLPELFATGYNLELLKDNAIFLGDQYYERIFHYMAKTARENSVYLIAPFARKDRNGVLYNSALFFNEEGNLAGSYDKNHLCALEKLYFKEGNRLPVFETKFGKIGIMICYDAGFPEVCRSLCLKGADIVFIPAAWRIQDSYMWDLNLPQRALENTIYICGCNRVGTEGELHLFGKSKICRPDGKTLEELPSDKEGVLVKTIDLEQIIKVRSSIPYLRDRKDTLRYDL